ncbi:MAG: hypothetical protein NTW59_01785 [Candidatus Diapherotrites archaeon]|nr:hypothetical protein [Candidatus Diapherotrites archaeon]
MQLLGEYGPIKIGVAIIAVAAIAVIALYLTPAVPPAQQPNNLPAQDGVPPAGAGQSVFDQNEPTPGHDMQTPLSPPNPVTRIKAGAPCATVDACTAKAVADKNTAECLYIVPSRPYPNELSDCVEQVADALEKSGGKKV